MDAPKLDALAYSKTEPQHGHSAFTHADIEAHLAVLPDWRFVAGDHGSPHGRIVKRFHFKNYYETIAFVNVVASISHVTNHHPDLIVHYNHCEVSYHTHDVEHGHGGLSNNDFICAARIEVAHRLL
ncbi:MAG: 4a-hydroxytetrahydrobiopterin dehydratase [Burkholderiales bacterium]|nr:4a-hydroxytetrahydrobiopterin dehydratase [Pseudomonadota bacterium]MCC7068083.1 4a-hydroxytetrahydrobiopterin dehydratase [Burkholderiales bacterium]